MSSRRKRILFDQTQNERGRLETTYSELGQLLTDHDYNVEAYTEYMIMSKGLEGASVFVLACPNSSKLRPPEIDVLRRFVQDGGGLMLLSLSGGDKGLMNNMSILSKNFGVEFDNTAVKDDRHNAGLPTLPIIRGLVAHPISDDVKEIVMPSPCSLRLSGKAVAVAATSEVADPPGQPVIATVEYEKGRVICVGSYEVFRKGGGLKNDGNVTFAVKCFKWLSGDILMARPSQVVAAQAKTEEGRGRLGEAADSGVSAETEKTLRRLINTVFDLQKDIGKVNEGISRAEKSIETLRTQFQDFAERIQQQLGVMMPARQFKTEDENRAAEVEADVMALEKELRSVQQLRDHIEQKHSSGAMTKEVYLEQTQKLDERIANLNKRVAEKREELKRLGGQSRDPATGKAE